MRNHAMVQRGKGVGPPREIRFLGYRVHPLTGPEVITEVTAAVHGRQRLIMANLNLHGMAVQFDSPAMAALHCQPDAQVMIDGMPILFLANLCGHKLARSKRTTSLDFYDDMFALGMAEKWVFAFVGADPDTLARGLAKLRERFPDLDIEGRDGYFDKADRSPGSAQAEIIDWLRARSPDVVIVGMGMPCQEEWIASVQHDVDARVFMPTGAYLDYQVGTQDLTPRWIGQIGMEWAYRLFRSPKRLSYRYLIEPLVLATRLVLRPHPQRKH